jgi:mitochondrial fission protein ELM1
MKYFVWVFNDGKIGHEKQSLALLDMLKKEISLSIHFINISELKTRNILFSFIFGKRFGGKSLPRPNLLVGTGHRTHLAILFAQKYYKSKSIIIMKPTLPSNFFSLCIIPQHDMPPKRANIIISNGPLCSIENSHFHDHRKGLFLIGGPSKHYQWSEKAIITQIEHIVMQKDNLNIDWEISTSRRTPQSFLLGLLERKIPNLQITRFEKAEPGWLESRLKISGQTWVSQDSISMIQEAAQSGTKIGIIELSPKKSFYQSKRESRILNYCNNFTNFSKWSQTNRLEQYSEDIIDKKELLNRVSLLLNNQI